MREEGGSAGGDASDKVGFWPQLASELCLMKNQADLEEPLHDSQPIGAFAVYDYGMNEFDEVRPDPLASS